MSITPSWLNKQAYPPSLIFVICVECDFFLYSFVTVQSRQGEKPLKKDHLSTKTILAAFNGVLCPQVVLWYIDIDWFFFWWWSPVTQTCIKSELVISKRVQSVPSHHAYCLIGPVLSQSFLPLFLQFKHLQTSSNDRSTSRTFALLMIIHRVIINPYLCCLTSKCGVSYGGPC